MDNQPNFISVDFLPEEMAEAKVKLNMTAYDYMATILHAEGIPIESIKDDCIIVSKGNVNVDIAPDDSGLMTISWWLDKNKLH